jgi:hypothetical protein
MITEQLRQVLCVSVSHSPLEFGRVELRFLRIIGLWFSRWLCLFLLSLTNNFGFLFLDNWFCKLFPLLIFKCSRL